MAKIRITITTTHEFDPDTLPPEAYEAGATLEDKLKVELDAANDDPDLYAEIPGANTVVTGEIIP